MQGMRRRRLVVAGLVASAAIGAGTALAAGSGGPAKTFWDDVAGRLGVSPAKLHTAMEQALADRLNQLVQQGKLTRAQADAIEARFKANGGVTPFFFGPPMGRMHGPGFFGHERFHRFGGPFVPGGMLQAAAGYLGVSVPSLVSDLRSGKTLASVAEARGKSVPGLEQAMVAAARTHLDAAAKAGDLTKQQEAHIVADISAMVKRFVEHGPMMGFRDHDDGPGLGSDRGGMPMAGPAFAAPGI
jgi:AraC-like DNA-binding protein